MLDVRTVIFGYIISNAICAIVMALLSIRNRRRFAGLELWLTNFILQFVGALLTIFRGVLPDFVAVVMAPALSIAGNVIMLTGLERFVGKHTSQLHNYILLAVFIFIQTFFTLFQPSAAIRVINFSLALIVVLAQSAWLMLRRVDISLLPTTRGVGYLFLIFGLVELIHFIAGLFVNTQAGLLESSMFDALYTLANQMLYIVLTFSLILMVNRHILEELPGNNTDHMLLEKDQPHRANVLAALHQVTLDLVNRREVDDILQTLLAGMGVLLDASNFSFDLIENNDGLVRFTITPEHLLKKDAVVSKAQNGSLSWEVIESGQPLILEDYSASRDRDSHTDKYPLHAIMIIPIRQSDHMIGAMNISRSEANKPFSDTDIYAARQFALVAAFVLDNSQLYAQLDSDLTERMQSQTRLRELQTQVIDERQRMARDLHDSVSQSIHSLVLFSETLVSTLDKNNLERARQISQRVQEGARQALKEARLLLYQTQGSIEGRDVDLIEQLNARLANVELRAGVRAQLILEGSLEYCPVAWHENLFWITIEALNNSLKHAQATRLQVNVRSFPKYVELEVKDNGRGFDTARPNAGGYGLRTMQERADLLGGELTLTSSPAKGTSVLLRAEIKE